MSEKKENFKRLAEHRVNNTLKNIRLISNLANRNNYDYSEEDVKKIFRAIREELNEAETKFKTDGKSSIFKL